MSVQSYAEPKSPRSPSGLKGYRKISQEEIQSAGETNLVDFLMSRGEKLERRGATYFWVGGGNNSIAIDPRQPNMFTHFAHGTGGNAINFCREYLGMGFQEAVEALNGGRYFPQEYDGAGNTARNASQHASQSTAHSKPPAQEREPFIPLTKANNGLEKLFSYLSGKRNISKRVVYEFFDADSLYLAHDKVEGIGKTGKPYSFTNEVVCFIAKDFDGKPTGTIKRSTGKGGFKGNHTNSDMRRFCFRHEGEGSAKDSLANESGRLFVFEAPVDMLSFITYMERKEVCERMVDYGESEEAARYNATAWKQDNFLALGGTNPSPVLEYVSHKASAGKPINDIWLALDHDEAGIKGSIRLVNELREAGYTGEIRCYFPKGKDWNEDLQEAVRHRDWEGGRWNSGFQQRHLSANTLVGDIDVLEGFLQEYLNKHLFQQQQLHAEYSQHPNHNKVGEPTHGSPQHNPQHNPRCNPHETRHENIQPPQSEGSVQHAERPAAVPKPQEAASR